MTASIETYLEALDGVAEARDHATSVARDLDFHALLPVGTCAQLTGAHWVDFEMLGAVVTITDHDAEGPAFKRGDATFVVYSGPEGDYAAVPHAHPEEDE